MQYHYFLISLRIRLQLRTWCWLVITWSSCLSGDLELWHCTPTHLGKTEVLFEVLSSKVLSFNFELERNVKGLKTISQFFNIANALLSGNNKHYRWRLHDHAKVQLVIRPEMTILFISDFALNVVLYAILFFELL